MTDTRAQRAPVHFRMYDVGGYPAIHAEDGHSERPLRLELLNVSERPIKLADMETFRTSAGNKHIRLSLPRGLLSERTLGILKSRSRESLLLGPDSETWSVDARVPGRADLDIDLFFRHRGDGPEIPPGEGLTVVLYNLTASPAFGARPITLRASTDHMKIDDAPVRTTTNLHLHVGSSAATGLPLRAGLIAPNDSLAIGTPSRLELGLRNVSTSGSLSVRPGTSPRVIVSFEVGGAEDWWTLAPASDFGRIGVTIRWGNRPEREVAMLNPSAATPEWAIPLPGSGLRRGEGGVITFTNILTTRGGPTPLSFSAIDFHGYADLQREIEVPRLDTSSTAEIASLKAELAAATERLDKAEAQLSRQQSALNYVHKYVREHDVVVLDSSASVIPGNLNIPNPNKKEKPE